MKMFAKGSYQQWVNTIEQAQNWTSNTYEEDKAGISNFRGGEDSSQIRQLTSCHKMTE